jgi:thiosulfate dehydrogenase (quinone) large subunit
VALLSLVVLFSPTAKEVSVDAGLARRSPGLSPLLLNRRRRGRA